MDDSGQPFESYRTGPPLFPSGETRRFFAEAEVQKRLRVEYKLVNHPHVRPVILELVAAVQADDVVLAGGNGHIPVRVDGAAHGDRRGCGKGLRKLFVRAADRKQLENFVNHKTITSISRS
jgi:hypothetical protein